MKPTYQQVDELVAALTALGATPNKVFQRGTQEFAEPVPYRFGAKSKEVRQAAAHNLRLLRPFQEERKDLQSALLLEISGNTGFIPDSDSEHIALYNLRERDLLKTCIKEDLPLEPIAEDDLNLEQNPIPPAVVAALAMIPVPPPKKTDA